MTENTLKEKKNKEKKIYEAYHFQEYSPKYFSMQMTRLPIMAAVPMVVKIISMDWHRFFCKSLLCWA